MEKFAKFKKASDVRGFLVLLLDYALIASIVLFSVYCDQFFIYLISVFLIGIVQYSIGEVLIHEASHNHLFKSQRLNSWLSFLYALPFFNVFSEYKKEHMLHHKYLGHEEYDHIVTDYKKMGLSNANNNIIWTLLIKPFLGYAGYLYVRDIIWVMLKKHPVQLLSFWFAVTLIFYYYNCLSILLLYWFVPLLWSFTFQLFWHEVSEHYRTVSGTRSQLNLFQNILHHNNGYHALHHQYPAIPWYKLPDAHLEALQEHPEMSTDVAYGFWHLLGQLYHSNKQNQEIKT